MNERSICAALMAKLRAELPEYVILRHVGLSGTIAGIPDFSVTGYKLTTWFEVKYLRPGNTHLRSRGTQDLMMLRLATAGRERYIIYEELDGVKKVCIVGATAVHAPDPTEWRAVGEWMSGFKHAFVVDYIRRTHENLKPGGDT